VLLDLYGTNHDARIWGDPETFRPERFRDRDGSAFKFIPQGGGDHHEGHRCAGEWITIQLMKVAVRLLTRSIRYDVPEQDLRFRLSRMPAVPECRFVISNVRRTGG
jgi:fatty-acid peroxygenase